MLWLQHLRLPCQKRFHQTCVASARNVNTHLPPSNGMPACRKYLLHVPTHIAGVLSERQ